MAVGTEHCLPWPAESLLMYRMADAIASPTIPDPEPLTCTKKEEMIIGVLMVFLNEIVVNILAREFRSRAVQLAVHVERRTMPGHHFRGCFTLRLS